MGKDSLYAQARSCVLYPWDEQDTCTALPGTWPWASLPPARTQTIGKGPHWGVFFKEVMRKRRWGREVTQLQQSGLFIKKNHI